MNKASFLLLALLVVVSVSITACANNGENQVSEHTHEFSEWITTKSPDCGNSGSRERICPCGEKEIEALIPTGEHIEGVVLGYDATCTEYGLTDGTKCSVCNVVLVDQEKIAPNGHNYVNRYCQICQEHSDSIYSEGLSFTSNGDGSCYVDGIGYCRDTELIIPPTSPEGEIVTSIGDRAFLSNLDITSVVIAENVTKIGVHSFGICYSLKTVVIGDSVTEICDYAFVNCTGLESVSMGNNVTSIGKRTFNECKALSSIEIPDSVTSLGDYAFAGCFELVTVRLSKRLTTIGQETFSRCLKLSYIVIPDGVTTIGDWAFNLCEDLVAIYLPSSVTSIGDRAFGYCYQLNTVHYSGTEYQWESILIGSENSDLTSAYICLNCTGN